MPIVLACLGVLCAVMMNPSQGFTTIEMKGDERPLGMFRSVEILDQGK